MDADICMLDKTQRMHCTGLLGTATSNLDVSGNRWPIMGTENAYLIGTRHFGSPSKCGGHNLVLPLQANSYRCDVFSQRRTLHMMSPRRKILYTSGVRSFIDKECIHLSNVVHCSIVCLKIV